MFRGVELDDLMLSGPGVELRPWRDSDASRVAEVMQDERMHGYLSVPDPYSHADARAFVRAAALARADGSSLEAAVVEPGGRVVGACALRLGREPDIGYWVATDSRGHAYGAKAARTLAEWGFGTGLRRIGLVCSSVNVASVATALAAGFCFEGIARDGFTDDAYEGIPAREGSLARFARLSTDGGAPVAPAFAPLPDGQLSDGVVRLRIALPEDAEGLMSSDDEVTLRWSFDGRPTPEDRARAATADAGLNWLVGRVGLLSVIDAGTGEWAGEVALRSTGPPGVCALGYVVHPAFRGRGYATRALRLVADWAFGPAGMARLELGAKIGNVASRRVAANAGFAYEGIFAGRLQAADGTYHDEARYALRDPAREDHGTPAPA